MGDDDHDDHVLVTASCSSATVEIEVTATSSYEPVITNLVYLDQVATIESASAVIPSLQKIEAVGMENIFHNDPELCESITEDLRHH